MKILHVTARGGSYIEANGYNGNEWDKYIRTVAGFVGITDVETIAIEKLTNGETGQNWNLQKEKAENCLRSGKSHGDLKALTTIGLSDKLMSHKGLNT